MSAYLIVHRSEITDSQALKDYADGVRDTIAKFGGETLARADSFEVLEGNWHPGEQFEDSRPERLTVIAFPDMETLRAWYDSPDYAVLKKIRLESSQSDIVAVNGL